MSIELVMPSNHLILCCPLLLLPSIFPSIRVFSSEPVLHLRRPIKKSHYLWSTSWRNKKANGITQSESKCPRTKGVTDGIPSLRLKAWKPGATNVRVRVQKSKNQGLWCSRAREDDFPAKKKGRQFALPSRFVSFRPQQIVWCLPTLVRVEVFPQSKNQKLISPKNTFTDTPRSNVTSAIWTTFSPIKLTYKINHL